MADSIFFDRIKGQLVSISYKFSNRLIAEAADETSADDAELRIWLKTTSRIQERANLGVQSLLCMDSGIGQSKLCTSAGKIGKLFPAMS